MYISFKLYNVLCFSDFDASQWRMLLEEECTRDGSGRVHEEVKGTFVWSHSKLEVSIYNYFICYFFEIPLITVVSDLQDSEKCTPNAHFKQIYLSLDMLFFILISLQFLFCLA